LPEIGRIQSTNFQSLLTELGITRNNIPFALRSEVTPVVLVGGTVSFLASPTPPYGVVDIFSAGVITNPAAGFALADTGPLPIGAYSVQILMSIGENALLNFAWRDAANATDLVAHAFRPGDTNPRTLQFSTRLNIANDNERFRVTAAALGAANYQVTILAKI